MKLNGQKGEGKKIREQYKVRVYPTVLLLDSQGKEIDRLCGFNQNQKKEYMLRLTDYTQGKNTVADLLQRIEQDPDNTELQYQMAKKYAGYYELNQAKPYFENVLRLDPQNQLGYREEANGYLAVQTLYETGNDQPLWELLQVSTNEERILKGYQTLIRYYKSRKMEEQATNACESAVNRFPDNTTLLNQFAWHIYENKLVHRYGEGIQMARRAVSLRPESAHIWDTLAWLEFETGSVDSAVAHMKLAIRLEPDNEYFQKNLAQFEGR